jgi:NAD(P)-dependent dehydrogenase (short-subunit alcohol dehydrogenase family)
VLAGEVALVTGASRGVGKGVVLGLCEAGATVYLTGRSTRSDGLTGKMPGTIEDTAEQAMALGGTAIPLRCDHRDDDQARAVVERVLADHGRIDVLVNNVWGGYEYMHDRLEFHYIRAPFWERPLGLWDETFDAGPRAHYVTTALAAPSMIAARGGLIVTISFFEADWYVGDVIYSLAKGASARMMRCVAEDMRPYDVTALALYPGLVRTEAVLEADFDLSNSESPQFIGRVVAALAGDPDVRRHSGSALVAAEVASEYGIEDVDGRRPRTTRESYLEHARL